MIMRLTAVFLFAVIFYYLSPPLAHAEYVLPYPSYMPGNKLYRVTRIVDRLKKPFYFGTIARIKYHAALADKYLVEAKTLFEYKQYLLALDALSRSDREVAAMVPGIARGGKEGKDMRAFVRQTQEMCDTHLLILNGLKLRLPVTFEWTPEKSIPTTLPLGDRLTSSVILRSSIKENLPDL